MLELITPVTRAENKKPSDEEILNYFYNFINFLTEHRHLSIETDCHVAGGDKNVSTNEYSQFPPLVSARVSRDLLTPFIHHRKV